MRSHQGVRFTNSRTVFFIFTNSRMVISDVHEPSANSSFSSHFCLITVKQLCTHLGLWMVDNGTVEKYCQFTNHECTEIHDFTNKYFNFHELTKCCLTKYQLSKNIVLSFLPKRLFGVGHKVWFAIFSKICLSQKANPA